MKRLLFFCIKVALGTAIATSIVAFTGIICLTLVIFIFAVIGASASKTTGSDSMDKVIYGKENSPHRFVSIPINGMIVGDTSDVGAPLGIFSEQVTFGYEIKRTLYDLAEDSNVDGVILDINSPGGTIYGANAIADGVSYYRQKTNKPVVSFVSGLAASGAYWSAVSADEIVADAGTSVGSIGVISGPFQFYNNVIAESGGPFSGSIVTEKGIETMYVTAGKSKDFGNPYRRLTKDEINSMQSMVNNEYDSFTSYVSSRRNIPKDMIINTLGALLYDGKTALENGMIDKIGSRDEAYKELALKAKINDGDYSVSEKQNKKGFLMNLLESRGLIPTMKTSISFCGLTKVHLVYHGDVSQLCN